MIKLKNIVKVLLVALFVCAYSGNVWADPTGGCAGPCPNAGEIMTQQADGSCKCVVGGGNSQHNVNACQTLDQYSLDNNATFGELICTGKLIFYRLRDLIYVVAGFGIIAVAVGGFFGNLNWKWLGAIIISLVVIASAGELLALLTGSGGSSVVTNTLTKPTLQATAGAETNRYNKSFIDDNDPEVDKRIKWDANVERESAVNYNTIADEELGAGDVTSQKDDNGNG